MTYLSILEKFKILFNLLMDYEFILVISLIMLFITFCYIAKKLSTKKYILYMILSFVIIFGISIISNYKVLSNTFDNFTTIIFENIYFPSIYVYLGVLIISFISFVVSTFNIMLRKIYKVINSIMFVLNDILFVVILNIIAKNKIDIFSINSLYTNTSLVAILELSMGLFIVWILSLIAIYVTNVICDRMGKKRVYTAGEVHNSIIEIDDLEEKNNELHNINEALVMASEIDNISKNIVMIEKNNINNEIYVEDSSNIVKDNNVNELCVLEENDILENSIQDDKKEDSKITFNDILNGCIPVTYYDNNISEEEYTLYDPQNVYEGNYNKIKDMCIDKRTISLTELEDVQLLYTDVKEENVDNVLLDNKFDKILSVEELTLLEKERLSVERLATNTISLNDLINVIEKEDKNGIINESKIDNVYNSEYTLKDYKMFGKMLSDIKNRSNGTNINIGDAVALGLINNYSIDDCIKFKDLLESDLN